MLKIYEAELGSNILIPSAVSEGSQYLFTSFYVSRLTIFDLIPLNIKFLATCTTPRAGGAWLRYYNILKLR